MKSVSRNYLDIFSFALNTNMCNFCLIENSYHHLAQRVNTKSDKKLCCKKRYHTKILCLLCFIHVPKAIWNISENVNRNIHTYARCLAIPQHGLGPQLASPKEPKIIYI